jgi:uncharacterized DUF497 family protein
MNRNAGPISTSTGWIFADLNAAFFDNALVVPSRNKSKRWVTIGVSIRGMVVVVFAQFGARGRQHHQHAARKP